MRRFRPGVPLGAYPGIPDFLDPEPAAADPLEVLTRLTLLGVDRDATAQAIAAQQTVRQKAPTLAAEWDGWVQWCQEWQDDISGRLNEKVHFFRPNDDAMNESAEVRFVAGKLKAYKLRWAEAGASGMGFPGAQPSAPEVPPVEPPVVPPTQPDEPDEPEQPTPAEDTSGMVVLAALGLAVVGFYALTRGDR